MIEKVELSCYKAISITISVTQPGLFKVGNVVFLIVTYVALWHFDNN